MSDIRRYMYIMKSFIWMTDICSGDSCSGGKPYLNVTPTLTLTVIVFLILTLPRTKKTLFDHPHSNLLSEIIIAGANIVARANVGSSYRPSLSIPIVMYSQNLLISVNSITDSVVLSMTLT